MHGAELAIQIAPAAITEFGDRQERTKPKGHVSHLGSLD
jgi:hypothetical protein